MERARSRPTRLAHLAHPPNYHPAPPGPPFEAHRGNWQLMIKFVIAHPAVTVATPGTSDPEQMVDNLAIVDLK